MILVQVDCLYPGRPLCTGMPAWQLHVLFMCVREWVNDSIKFCVPSWESVTLLLKRMYFMKFSKIVQWREEEEEEEAVLVTLSGLLVLQLIFWLFENNYSRQNIKKPYAFWWFKTFDYYFRLRIVSLSFESRRFSCLTLKGKWRRTKTMH